MSEPLLHRCSVAGMLRRTGLFRISSRKCARCRVTPVCGFAAAWRNGLQATLPVPKTCRQHFVRGVPAWPAPTCSRCARSAACVLPAPSPIPRAFRDSYPPQRYATPLFTHALPPQATVLPPPAPIKMTNQQTELDQAVPVRTVATARSHCSAAARRLRPGQWQRTPLPRAPYPVARQKPSVSRQKPCPETLY